MDDNKVTLKDHFTENFGVILGPLLLLAAFFSLVLTLVSFLALLFGTINFGLGFKFYRRDAVYFLIRGVIGAALVPAFAQFCAVLFHFTVREDFWPYLVLAGYTLGSIIVGLWVETQRDRRTLALPAPSAKQIHRIAPPREEPFRFADWNDRGER